MIQESRLHATKPGKLKPPRQRTPRATFPLPHPTLWAAQNASSIPYFSALDSSVPHLPDLLFPLQPACRPASASCMPHSKSYPALCSLRPPAAQTSLQLVLGRCLGVFGARPFPPPYPPISASRIETPRAESRIPK